jgi:hypothetical protein
MKRHKAHCTVTASGWSTDDSGLGWLERVFQRYTKKEAQRRQRLLIMDGHVLHITMNFIDYCNKHKIQLCFYPPHSTKTLQPLDVVMFKPRSTNYSQELTQHLHTAQVLLPVKNGDFFRLFWAAWVRTLVEKDNTQVLQSYTPPSPPLAALLIHATAKTIGIILIGLSAVV